jgi:hypothetical protein
MSNASNGVTLVTPEFRVSYPRVFKPERNDLNGQDEYSLVALFAPGADLSPLKAAVKQAAVNKWGDSLPTNIRIPLRDGDEKIKDGAYPAGFEKGTVFVTMKCRKAPGVVDPQVQPILDDADFYGGCYARASVHVQAYDQKGNKGVSIYLNHVQKMRDGEAFGKGRVSPQQAFEAVAGAPASSGGAGGIFD